MQYDLVDQFGNVVAQGLGDCMEYAVLFNRRLVGVPKEKRPEFPYALHVFDSDGNEAVIWEERGAMDFLISVLDCVNRFGGEIRR